MDDLTVEMRPMTLGLLSTLLALPREILQTQLGWRIWNTESSLISIFGTTASSLFSAALSGGSLSIILLMPLLERGNDIRKSISISGLKTLLGWSLSPIARLCTGVLAYGGGAVCLIGLPVTVLGASTKLVGVLAICFFATSLLSNGSKKMDDTVISPNDTQHQTAFQNSGSNPSRSLVDRLPEPWGRGEWMAASKV